MLSATPTRGTPSSIGCRLERLCKKLLDGLTRTSTYIAARSNGQPRRDQKQSQKQMSNFLTGLAADGLIDEGRSALGDRDKRISEHYTRHVENQINVI
jgi:hypothetical protein